MIRRGIVLSLVLIIGGAWYAGSPEPVPQPSRDAGTLILRRQTFVSLSPPSALYALPEFSLYGDGRLLVPDGFDGAWPLVREYRITESTIDDLFRAASGARLFRDHSYRADGVVDGSLMALTLGSTGGRYETRIAIPEGAGTGARRRAVAFARELDPARWPPARLAGEPVRYRADRVAVLMIGGVATTGDVRPYWQQPRECEIVGAGVAALARAAQRTTTWISDGKPHVVVFRPLLPDEADCAALER